MDIRFVVKRYIDEGLVVLPVKPGEKATRFTNWSKPDTRPNPEDFASDDNVAQRLDGWCDIDPDTTETRAVAAKYLPPTERKHARPSRGVTHYWFKSPGIEPEVFKDVDGSVLIEIRTGHKQYTLIPPSKVAISKDNPSDVEELLWEQDRPASEHEPKIVRGGVVCVATVALLARHWPKGSRHFCALHAAGFLAARNVDPKLIEEIIGDSARLAGDEEVEDRKTAARTTVQEFKAGGKTTGGPSLEEHFGKKVVSILLSWYGGNESRHSGLVEEMNKRHFIVRVGKDAQIGDEEELMEKGAAGKLVLLSDRTMNLLYLNKLVKTGKKRKREDGEDDTPPEDLQRSWYDIWRRHPDRREYRQLDFAPPPAKAHPRDYNLWRGFGVQPMLPPEGHDARRDVHALNEWVAAECAPRCMRYLELVHDVICGGEPERQEEYYNYLLDLMALTVQQPGVPSEIAVVLKGPRGAGKGMFIRNFGDIFGHHYAQVSKPEQIVGKFNAMVSGKVVVFADEAFFAGDKRDLGALKVLITEPYLTIERKGIDAVKERNFVHLFMASNEGWHTPAGFNERRFFALSVSEIRMQDHDYFAVLAEELKNGGQPALLTFLLNRTISDERRQALRQAPRTNELRVQQERTLDPEMRWWRGCLMSGELGTDGGWPFEITANDLHADYIRWCDTMKVNRRTDLSTLVRDVLKPWMGEQRRTSDANGRRINLRKVLPLAEARARFDQEAGTMGVWPEVEGDGPRAKPDPEKMPF